MLTSIIKRSSSIDQESPQSLSLGPNPQKPNQKTSQSAQQQQLSPEEYTKLQELLQLRQSSLRQHAKHQYQLKLYIDDLQEKNKTLEKNNANILTQYKAEVTAFKKENEALRKMLQKLQMQNSQLKRQLQEVMLHQNIEKPQSVNIIPDSSHSRAKSQSIIKVIESVDHKHSFRDSQPNFRMSPYHISGKVSPIMPSQQSNIIQSQSREKLEVTMKSSQWRQNDRRLSSGRNQKNIQGTNMRNDDSVGRQRSIRKLLQLKKMSEGRENEAINKKVPSQSSQSIIKKWPQSHSSAYDYSNQSNQRDSLIIERNLSREMGSDLRKSIQSENIKQLALGQEGRSKQMKKTKANDHELIKLGHYGSTNLNGGKVNVSGQDRR